MKTCTHWKDIGNPQGGRCELHKKTCSFGVCEICPDNDGGDWWLAFQRKHKLGTKVKNAIGKIPGAKRLPCYDRHGNLKPGSRCGNNEKYLNGERKQDTKAAT